MFPFVTLGKPDFSSRFLASERTGLMPLQRKETIHDVECKWYDGGTVMIGTTTARFTIKVPADEVSWFSTRLRAELIKRQLATADELAVDEAGEAAMAAKAEAAAKEAAKKAAAKKAMATQAASPRRKTAAALEAAEHAAMRAEQKRSLAESQHRLAEVTAKVAKVAPCVAQLAKMAPAPLQTKLESFLQRCPL